MSNGSQFPSSSLSSYSQRRILVKYGKISGIRVTRYYELTTDQGLSCYTGKKVRVPKAFISLIHCEIIAVDESKVQGIKHSLRIAKNAFDRPFWIHPLTDSEFMALRRYCEGCSLNQEQNSGINAPEKPIKQQLLLPRAFNGDAPTERVCGVLEVQKAGDEIPAISLNGLRNNLCESQLEIDASYSCQLSDNLMLLRKTAESCEKEMINPLLQLERIQGDRLSVKGFTVTMSDPVTHTAEEKQSESEATLATEGRGVCVIAIVQAALVAASSQQLSCASMPPTLIYPICLDEEENGKQIEGGGYGICNFSSSTLQNLYFPETIKHYSDTSYAASFFDANHQPAFTQTNSSTVLGDGGVGGGGGGGGSLKQIVRNSHQGSSNNLQVHVKSQYFKDYGTQVYIDDDNSDDGGAGEASEQVSSNRGSFKEITEISGDCRQNIIEGEEARKRVFSENVDEDSQYEESESSQMNQRWIINEQRFYGRLMGRTYQQSQLTMITNVVGNSSKIPATAGTNSGGKSLGVMADYSFDKRLEEGDEAFNIPTLQQVGLSNIIILSGEESVGSVEENQISSHEEEEEQKKRRRRKIRKHVEQERRSLSMDCPSSAQKGRDIVDIIQEEDVEEPEEQWSRPHILTFSPPKQPELLLTVFDLDDDDDSIDCKADGQQQHQQIERDDEIPCRGDGDQKINEVVRATNDHRLMIPQTATLGLQGSVKVLSSVKGPQKVTKSGGAKKRDIALMGDEEIHMLSREESYSLGYKCLWQFNFVNAGRVFEAAKEKGSAASRLTFEYATIESLLLQIIVTGSRELVQKTEAALKGFIEKHEVSEKKYEGEEKVVVELMKAEGSAIRGLLLSLMGSKFQAFLAFKSAFNSFKKAREIVEEQEKKRKLEKAQQVQKEKDSGSGGNSNGFDEFTMSRYYFTAGLFNIGLSMVPSYFLKILSLLGISPDKQYGYVCLEKCVELASIRIYYAALLLCIEYTELNPNVDKAITIIKKMIKLLPSSPLFYWMASLLSWRFSKPDDALVLINKSLVNCGVDLSERCYYLRFEKGWYCVSQLDWRAALCEFEVIAIMSMDIHLIDISTLAGLTVAKKMSRSTLEEFAGPLIEKARKIFVAERKTILPHKCCLAALVACCFEFISQPQIADLWFLICIAVFKRSSEQRTQVDEEITKLAAKYVTRENKKFVKYEVLYFVKEITKLRSDMLAVMVAEINEHFLSLNVGNVKTLLVGKKVKTMVMVAALPDIIDVSSTIFLRIVGGCLMQDYDTVFSMTPLMNEIAELVPSDHAYILHHSYHWLARCYLQQNRFEEARVYLKKCLKYKKCEFSLEAKTIKLQQEIASKK